MHSRKSITYMALALAAMAGEYGRDILYDGPYHSAAPAPLTDDQIDRIKRQIIEERAVKSRKKHSA